MNKTTYTKSHCFYKLSINKKCSLSYCINDFVKGTFYTIYAFQEISGDGICCSVEQLELLKVNFVAPAQLFKNSCPTCYFNFVKNFCDLTCSPHQSEFLKVEKYVTGPGSGDYENMTMEMVSSVLYHVHKEFNEATFDSCKNVQFPGLSGTVMVVACGPWGEDYCTAERWWNYLGTTENGYSPFDISYEYGDTTTSETGFTYHNQLVTSCKDPPPFNDGLASYAGCKCVDCEDACSGSLDEPKLEPVETDFLISGMDGMTVIAVAIFTSITLIFISIQLRWVGDAFLNAISTFFTWWGKIASTYPKTVIGCSLFIAIGLSIGIVNLEVTTDPIELWASPLSRSRVEKDFFDSEFRPFYRTAQVIIKSIESPENEITQFSYTDVYGENKTYGPVFNKKFLLDVLTLQEKIQNLTFSYKNETLSLVDVCNQPLGIGCNIQNIWGYWQDSADLLEIEANVSGGLYTYLDHFLDCSNNPALPFDAANTPCMSTWGGPVSPYYILGGFIPNGNTGFPKNPKYYESTALVMTIILDNYDTKSTDLDDITSLEKAMAWEEVFIDFMKDWESNEMPREYMEIAFNSERSIEDELNRETYGDLATIAISYILMFLYITISLGQYNTASVSGLMFESKITLGLFGVMIVLLSVSASVGIFGMIGIPATLIIFEIIPFLVLAVGVDNIFILVQSYQRSTRKDYESHAEHVGRIVGEIAPSMLLSSVSESTCFFLGSLSDMPAVRAFALYAGMALLIDFFMQITCFVALISLDMERQENTKKYKLCCLKPYHVGDSKKKDNGSLYWFFQHLYAPVLMKIWIRNIVMIVFIGFFCTSLAVGSKVEVGLDQEVSMPEDSFVLKYFLFLKDYLSVGPPVYFVVNNTNGALDFSKPEDQNKLCMGHARCNEVSLGTLAHSWAKIPEESFLATSAMNWVDNYISWVSDPACCRYFDHVAINTSTPKIPCPSEEDEEYCLPCELSTEPSEKDFQETIGWFLDANPIEACPSGGHAAFGDGVQIVEIYENQLNFTTGYDQPRYEVVHSNMMAFHTILKTSKDYYSALIRARELSAQMTEVMNDGQDPENHVTVFPYSIFYVFYEQYLTMWEDTMQSLVISLGAIFIVTFILMGFDLISSVIIIITIFFILVNLIGVMYWWHITLNAVSLVNLVMAVGISVEFCSHITRTFAMEPGADKVKRAEAALIKMGSSVLSGITLTKFSGIIVLGFAKSQIFTIFYFR